MPDEPLQPFFYSSFQPGQSYTGRGGFHRGLKREHLAYPLNPPLQRIGLIRLSTAVME